MTVSAFYERRERVLLVRMGRAFTREALAEINTIVKRVSAVEGPFRGIIDLSDVEEVLIEAGDLVALGQQPRLLPGQRRVIVAPRDALFGLSRMFSLYQGVRGDEPDVVRDLSEAHELLGLVEPEFVAIDATARNL